MRYISAVVASNLEEEDEEEYFVFDMNKMNSKISSTKATKEVTAIVRNEDINIGTSDVPYLKNFQI